jgi:multimeric flavodoxin WrbA
MSSTGTTEKMAEYVAEGVRMAGHEAYLKRISEISRGNDLAGFDGYIFGCPTYHLDIPQPFTSFLDMAQRAGLQGRAGGAFSSRTHPSSSEGGAAAARVFEIMELGLRMKMTELGPFEVKADVIDSPDGMRACQEYGSSIAKMLG